MKRMIRLIALMVLAGGWAVSAAALHLVITPGRAVVIPKDRLNFRETVVDARHWTLPDATGHAAVVNRLIATHNADVLGHVTKSVSYDDLVSQLSNAAAQANAAPTTQMARH